MHDGVYMHLLGLLLTVMKCKIFGRCKYANFEQIHQDEFGDMRSNRFHESKRTRILLPEGDCRFL
jgi:hypothetical protein